ncbi:MAG: hypothetical protein IH597_00025 [Bacteroidales bacterium]|nr:hypothetical protein [Bacteroidales bacterium]
MEAIIIQGESKSNSRLLIELARKLNFRVKKLTLAEMEDIGLAISINEGLQSGILDEKEKEDFLHNLKHSPDHGDSEKLF